MNIPAVSKASILLVLFVATFGYFVDVYDIWIFTTVRITSLKDLGVPAEAAMEKGILLINLQMLGMFLGGLVFGVLGDKIGRTRVMFISILTYSLATLANAFAPNLEIYAALRFLSGFGLAGELGLGATLISEILPREKRGPGAGILVGFGVLGAMAAGVSARIFDWKTCYLIGGVMGLVLLALRVKVAESPLFKVLEQKETRRGDLRMLFTKSRIGRFLGCVALGLPTWFMSGVLVTFSEEILHAANAPVLTAALLVIFTNLALPVGSFATIGLSQLLQKRRQAMAGFLLLAFAGFCALLFLPRPISETTVKALYGLMGFGVGSWVMMALIAAESFGTNLRATAATAVPNFARASVILMTLSLSALKSVMPLTHAAMILGAVCFTLPLIALWRLPETFHREMDYLED
jgi:MFS family permease